MANGDTNSFREWCILELMGHRRLGGLVTEAVVGGIPLLRIDIPGGPTQYYGKAAVYAMTPTTEELATALARSFTGPVQRYELPELTESGSGRTMGAEEVDSYGDDGYGDERDGDPTEYHDP